MSKQVARPSWLGEKHRAVRPALRCELLEDRSVPATITVTTTADSLISNDGGVSLREAITAINAGNDLGDADITAQSPGAFGTGDTINFNIAGSGVQTINVGPDASATDIALPTVTKSVLIDGYSQPGTSPNTLANSDNAVLRVELNGTAAGGVHGLVLAGGNSTVQGLVINRFAGAAIRILGGGNNVVRGNFLGTDVTGTAVPGAQGGGVTLESGSNVIGGTAPADRNVVSGNRGGIGAGSGNVVCGNFIGTDRTGTADLGNIVGVGAGTDTRIGGTLPGERNVIAGTGQTGLGLDTRATGVVVQGNLIGTDVTGTRALGSFQRSFDITGNANVVGNMLIGGAAPGAGNVIAGANEVGIFFNGSANHVTVQGNFIGTDITGTRALGSTKFGIAFFAGSNSNLIGGTTPGAGNVISGNRVGLYIADEEVHGNVIQGNFIGTQANGVSPLGNSSHGVVVTAKSFGNVIGGSAPGAGNIIAFNGGDGILIGEPIPSAGLVSAGNAGTGNAVLGNSIFGNGLLGIDLGVEGGVAPNQPGGGTSGPNGFQNAPNLISVLTVLGVTTVHGTLDSTPNTTFRIELFESDPSGFGQGTRFIGFVEVTTDATGTADFTFTPDAPVALGQVVTATATDPAGNTSEFSPGATASASLPEPAQNPDTTPDAPTPETQPDPRATGAGDGPVDLPDFGGSGTVAPSPFVGYSGGLHSAIGDVDNDGVNDILSTPAVAGTSGAPLKVISGSTGQELFSFFAFDSFNGVAEVALGDVNGDGFADIIVGAASGSGTNGHVKVFSGRNGTLLASFFSFQGFDGGVSVAVGDVNGDGKADVIVGTLAGAPSAIKVFSGRTLTNGTALNLTADGAVFQAFLPFTGSYMGGLSVASGDVDHDGFADIIAGALDAQDGPVAVFRETANGLQPATQFLAFPGVRSGVRVQAFNVGGDAADEVLAFTVKPNTPRSRAFSGVTGLDVEPAIDFSEFTRVFVG